MRRSFLVVAALLSAFLLIGASVQAGEKSAAKKRGNIWD